MINEMQVLRDLEYTRTWGTKEELKAAKYIQKVLKTIKLDSKIESFKLNDGKKVKVSLEVTKPYKKKINCHYFKMCANTKGLEKEIVFVKDVKQINKYDVNNKIALITGGLGYWTYKDLLDGGCKGIVVGNGNLFYENNDIDTRALREPLQELGKIPVVACNIKDLYEMLQNGVTKVKITSIQELTKCDSHNVIANIKGESQRRIIFTAHYDSTALSKGSWDNASGSVGIMKIAEHFMKNKPYHNLTFIWCGAEERGLCGSKAYVKKHLKELNDVDLCINLDMIGATLGKFLACVTAEEKLVNYVEYMSFEFGKACDCYQDVYASDSTPFADVGIPGISFGQHNPDTPIHTRFDTMYLMNEKTLKEDEEFIIEFASRMANAKVIPVSRVMPDNIKEKIDAYLLRKRAK